MDRVAWGVGWLTTRLIGVGAIFFGLVSLFTGSVTGFFVGIAGTYFAAIMAKLVDNSVGNPQDKVSDERENNKLAVG